MEKIAGLVVLHHPDFSKLIQNISSYINHVDQLWIICNSFVTHEEKTKLLSLYKNCIFIVNNENLGIAKALNQAANIAFESGYDWLLTMDQDSHFISDNFFHFFRKVVSDQVAIYAPNAGKITRQDSIEEQTLIKVLYVITSGNLLNLRIWKKLDGFNEKLFIDEVDHDYCLKAVSNNYQILQFKNIPLYHELGKAKEVSILFKKFTVVSHSPIRTYYIFRNNFYIFGKYGNEFPEFIKERKRILRKTFLEILLFAENKTNHLRMLYFAFKDYRKGRYGKL